jgi:hypothetical protein
MSHLSLSRATSYALSINPEGIQFTNAEQVSYVTLDNKTVDLFQQIGRGARHGLTLAIDIKPEDYKLLNGLIAAGFLYIHERGAVSHGGGIKVINNQNQPCFLTLPSITQAILETLKDDATRRIFKITQPVGLNKKLLNNPKFTIKEIELPNNSTNL